MKGGRLLGYQLREIRNECGGRLVAVNGPQRAGLAECVLYISRTNSNTYRSAEIDVLV